MNRHPLDYHQWPLFVFCFLFVVFHHLYNKGFIPMIWIHSMSHKQAHTTYQEENTHIPIQTHIPLTNQTMTRLLKKLMIICVTLIIGLNFIPHQPQLSHPQHTFPHINQTQNITPHSDPLSPRWIHPPSIHPKI